MPSKLHACTWCRCPAEARWLPHCSSTERWGQQQLSCHCVQMRQQMRRPAGPSAARRGSRYLATTLLDPARPPPMREERLPARLVLRKGPPRLQRWSLNMIQSTSSASAPPFGHFPASRMPLLAIQLASKDQSRGSFLQSSLTSHGTTQEMNKWRPQRLKCANSHPPHITGSLRGCTEPYKVA